MRQISCIKLFNKTKIITWYLVLHIVIHICHIQDYIEEWNMLYFFLKKEKMWFFAVKLKKKPNSRINQYLDLNHYDVCDLDVDLTRYEKIFYHFYRWLLRLYFSISCEK